MGVLLENGAGRASRLMMAGKYDSFETVFSSDAFAQQ